MFLYRSAHRSFPRIKQQQKLSTYLTTRHLRRPILKYHRFAYSTKMNPESEWDSMIDFWFNRDTKDWFSPPPGLDEELQARYGDLIKQARAHHLDSWADHPKGALCLVLLLDQFPRNIFRGSGESFSSDIQAQKMVTQAISKGFDKEIGKSSTVKQSMFYLPFMHAEDVLSQIACRALYEAMAYSLPEDSKERQMHERSVLFADRHLKCVCRFGRFPARNKDLGRPNTDEEEQYLAENPTGF